MVALDQQKLVAPAFRERRPEAVSFRVEDLLADLESGRIRLPSFQRGMRWEWSDRQLLLDSIYNGFPIGTLLMWKRNLEAGEVELGPLHLNAMARSDGLLVVDGQQRLAALVGALSSKVGGSGERSSYGLWFDLHIERFERPRGHSAPPRHWVPLEVIIDAEDLFRWLDSYRSAGGDDEGVRKAIRLGKLVREYEIPAYLIDSADEDRIRTVFDRTNSAGKPLDQHEIFDAIHGRTDPGAATGTLGQLRDELDGETFGAPSADFLLRILRALHDLDPRPQRSARTGLSEIDNMSAAIERTEAGVRRAIAYLAVEAGIPHVRLLPYKMPMLLLAVFLDRNPEPSPRSLELLRRWVWRGAITGAHSGDSLATRHALSLLEGNEEDVVQRLLRELPSEPSSPLLLSPLNFRSAPAKLGVLALASLRPRHLVSGRELDLSTLMRERDPARKISGQRPPSGWSSMDPALVASLSNRALHPAVRGRGLWRLLQAAAEQPEWLRSHGVDPSAESKLRVGDLEGFLAARGAYLSKWVSSFLRSRARWGHSDRPSLASLVIADE